MQIQGGGGTAHIEQYGGEGNNTMKLMGDTGDDVIAMYGGPGNNTITYTVTGGNDLVTILGGGGYNTLTIWKNAQRVTLLRDYQGHLLFQTDSRRQHHHRGQPSAHHGHW